MAKFRLTPRGYTRTGIWTLIDQWLEKLLSVERRRQRAEARKREEIAAKERTRRENVYERGQPEKLSTKTDRTAAAFDRRIRDRRKAQ